MRASTQAAITIDRPPLVVWNHATDITTLPKMFVGWGPIPAVKKVEVIKGEPMTPGMKQRTTTVDGRVIDEQILTVRKPEYFDYQLLKGFGFPFTLFVRMGGGSWTFTPKNSGTMIRWEYYFELTSLLAYPVGAMLVKFFWKNAMKAYLRELKKYTESLIAIIKEEK